MRSPRTLLLKPSAVGGTERSGIQNAHRYGHRGASRRVPEALEHLRHHFLPSGGAGLQVEGAKRALDARGRGSSNRP
jgi:hypothetical protein